MKTPFILNLFINSESNNKKVKTHDWKFDPWKSNRPFHERSYTCKKCEYWVLLSKNPDPCRIPTVKQNKRIHIRARHWKTNVTEFESCKEVIMKKALE